VRKKTVNGREWIARKRQKKNKGEEQKEGKRCDVTIWEGNNILFAD